ncbi:MAG: DNA-binding protein [Pseudonocardiales bacterium]|nr:DNA-binding protein [Pseudonocardiales bacterium]
MTEQPPVVAMAEIVDMLAVSRKRVSVLTNAPDFPAPIATLTAGRIWAYQDVKKWAERSGRTVHPIAVR